MVSIPQLSEWFIVAETGIVVLVSITAALNASYSILEITLDVDTIRINKTKENFFLNLAGDIYAEKDLTIKIEDIEEINYDTPSTAIINSLTIKPKSGKKIVIRSNSLFDAGELENLAANLLHPENPMQQKVRNSGSIFTKPWMRISTISLSIFATCFIIWSFVTHAVFTSKLAFVYFCCALVYAQLFQVIASGNKGKVYSARKQNPESNSKKP